MTDGDEAGDTTDTLDPNVGTEGGTTDDSATTTTNADDNSGASGSDPNAGIDPASPQGAYLDGSYFTDGDQLTKSLVDERATDQLMRSSYADAQGVVNDFLTRSDASPWTSLDRADVGRRLLELVSPGDDGVPAPATGPRSLRQGALNLCGPTAFFHMAMARDPVAVMQFAVTLFETGAANLGDLQVAPSQDLLQADFPAMQQKGNYSFQAAEWMLFGALRNTMDVFWQGTWEGDPSQNLSAMTRPEEVASWMRSTGIWASVEDNGKWASNPGMMNAADITMSPGMDVAFLIHANLIAKSTLWNPTTGAPDDGPNPQANPIAPDNTFLLSSFPDHWILLMGQVIPTTQNTVLSSIWSWGARYYLCTPSDVFNDNYYGSIIGHFADPNQGG